jgi:RNA polymerase sigma-70 factor (ECF subfamily)
MRNERCDRFEDLYKQFGADVLAYALRRSSPEVADEVVAETFLVTWRRLEEVPGEPLPWLLAVARRKLSNARRSTMRYEALRERLAREPVAQGSGVLSGDADFVLERLWNLPENYREALFLVAWEGLTDRQAARVVGCSPTAFRLRLHRGRKRLLRELRARHADTPTGPLFIERSETC